MSLIIRITLLQEHTFYKCITICSSPYSSQAFDAPPEPISKFEPITKPEPISKPEPEPVSEDPKPAVSAIQAAKAALFASGMETKAESPVTTATITTTTPAASTEPVVSAAAESPSIVSEELGAEEDEGGVLAGSAFNQVVPTAPSPKPGQVC